VSLESFDNVEVKQAELVWQDCLQIIRENTNVQKFKSWFEPIRPVKLEKDTLTIQVPTHFWYEWLEEQYYNLLRSTITRVMGPNGKLEYSIVVEKSDKPEQQLSLNMPQRPVGPLKAQDLNSYVNQAPVEIKNPFVIPGLKKVKVDSNLNQNYVFERFIEGDCNRLARSAAMAVAENPGKSSFNPLFVYGGVGLGKTHLVHCIGNKIKQLYGDEKAVLYTTLESFTNEFIRAVQSNRASEFTTFYRHIDVLMVDDIQFLSGKEKTQDVFFHIFNTLHMEGKQIILSSDRAPKDIPQVMERLISRFNWGLSADLQMPDYETRYAILERKANDNGIQLPHEILEFIAHNFKSSIRDMEGAIVKLLAASTLQRFQDFDLATAKRVLKDLIKDSKNHISIESIQSHVSEICGIDTNKLKEKTRKKEIVEARQIAMYLSKNMTKSSLKTIGLHFGGRDHSTVVHAIESVEHRIRTNTRTQRMIRDLQHKIELASL
jgi:chromosomal replication initiator protein